MQNVGFLMMRVKCFLFYFYVYIAQGRGPKLQVVYNKFKIIGILDLKTEDDFKGLLPYTGVPAMILVMWP